MQLRAGAEQRVSKLNGFLEEVSRTCDYRHWYFGSLHEDRTLTPKFTSVVEKGAADYRKTAQKKLQ